jgi:hypothetical protein
VLYRHRNKVLGYGVKMWPAGAERLLAEVA